MKKGIIISSALTFVSVVLGCYMCFAKIPEYPYFLIIETISILFFAIAVVTLVFGAMMSKATDSARLKKIYGAIVSALVAVAVLYTPCAFISSYNGYIPEMHYINNTDYVQQFLPITDISEIKTKDDLLQSAIIYSTYPGFSELVVCDINGFDRYDLVYTKSLNPVYNLRGILGIRSTLITESVNGDWESDKYNIDGNAIHVYSNRKAMYGYIKNYGNIMTVMVNNCNEIFTSNEDFAEYIFNQYELADECLTSQHFRDAPWYDAPFYIKAWTEHYTEMEYFL